MTLQGLLLMVLVGLLLLPIILGLLEQMFPLIRRRLEVAIPATANFAGQAFHQAGSLVSEQHTLSPS